MSPKKGLTAEIEPFDSFWEAPEDIEIPEGPTHNEFGRRIVFTEPCEGLAAVDDGVPVKERNKCL